eukprot:1722783-Rhodomonas_salina.1
MACLRHTSETPGIPTQKAAGNKGRIGTRVISRTTSSRGSVPGYPGTRTRGTEEFGVCIVSYMERAGVPCNGSVSTGTLVPRVRGKRGTRVPVYLSPLYGRCTPGSAGRNPWGIPTIVPGVPGQQYPVRSGFLGTRRQQWGAPWILDAQRS